MSCVDSVNRSLMEGLTTEWCDGPAGGMCSITGFLTSLILYFILVRRQRSCELLPHACVWMYYVFIYMKILTTFVLCCVWFFTYWKRFTPSNHILILLSTFGILASSKTRDQNQIAERALFSFAAPANCGWCLPSIYLATNVQFHPAASWQNHR